jgi:hypothetical protein
VIKGKGKSAVFLLISLNHGTIRVLDSLFTSLTVEVPLTLYAHFKQPMLMVSYSSYPDNLGQLSLEAVVSRTSSSNLFEAV